ncbi:MAG TPA: hypothetical protein VEE83_03810 [Thermoplasmata archaeon]|nr:hypothetical protein [Thermoplasmata archaeon]
MPPPTLPPLAPGELHDTGTVRRDSVAVERWMARGVAKVTGDVRVTEGTLDGTLAVGGRVSAKTLRYQGTVDVTGSVDVQGRLSGSGTLRLGLTLHAQEIDLRGTVRVLGAASVDRAMRVRGVLTAPSLAVGELDVEGEVHIPGPTSATVSVSARLSDDSQFGFVRARSVSLRAKVPNLVEKVLGRRVTVTVDRIEADQVSLEAVDAKFVRSPRITLGRNAHVTEYEGTIVARHPSSRVGFESRSPPPYGLTR